MGVHCHLSHHHTWVMTYVLDFKAGFSFAFLSGYRTLIIRFKLLQLTAVAYTFLIAFLDAYEL